MRNALLTILLLTLSSSAAAALWKCTGAKGMVTYVPTNETGGLVTCVALVTDAVTVTPTEDKKTEDECSDQAVFAYNDKYLAMDKEWRQEWRYAKTKPGGGLEATPRSNVLMKEMSPVRQTIDSCADKGNAWAMYFRGMEALSLAQLQKSVADNEDIKRMTPTGAVQMKVSAMTSFDDANKWFSLSAEKGNPAAMRQLGINHNQGLGFPQNRLLAMEWLYKAASVFLDTGNRNAALIAGNDMREIEAQHPLTLRIMGRLYSK